MINPETPNPHEAFRLLSIDYEKSVNDSKSDPLERYSYEPCVEDSIRNIRGIVGLKLLERIEDTLSTPTALAYEYNFDPETLKGVRFGSEISSVGEPKRIVTIEHILPREADIALWPEVRITVNDIYDYYEDDERGEAIFSSQVRITGDDEIFFRKGGEIIFDDDSTKLQNDTTLITDRKERIDKTITLDRIVLIESAIVIQALTVDTISRMGDDFQEYFYRENDQNMIDDGLAFAMSVLNEIEVLEASHTDFH
jgi:hypothetical protein